MNGKKTQQQQENKANSAANSVALNTQNITINSVFEDNRSESLSQLKMQRVMANDTKNAFPIAQRTIIDIDDWEGFVAAYQAVNGDAPSDFLRASVEIIIAEEGDPLTFQQAFDRAYQMALGEYEDEIESTDVYVRVADLVPQLDQDQHRPDLVAYDAETGTVTQTPTDEESGATHYGQGRLEGVRDVQNSEEEVDQEQVQSIFFELLSENEEVAITTGDGRHRIAMYNAMGVTWIRAAITASQREILVARGIDVEDEIE